MKLTKEGTFRGILICSALTVGVLVFIFFISLLWGSLPVFKKIGAKFFFHSNWDPVTNDYGALPFFIGTLITSFLALIISLPLSFSIAVLLGEFHRAGKISSFFKSMVDLIAAVPSVIYGFWGLMILVPVVQNIEMKIGVAPYGVGIMTASIILSVMIIPNTASLAREVVELVPADIKEAAYALGATHYEVIKKVVVPYAISGIFAGVLLSLGRAIGETMAVTMVIGNANVIPRSIFAPANTMASVIANEFAEASGDIHYAALIGVGITLFILTTSINMIGRYIIKKLSFEE
jgi:phosphate transport system permease protein